MGVDTKSERVKEYCTWSEDSISEEKLNTVELMIDRYMDGDLDDHKEITEKYQDLLKAQELVWDQEHNKMKHSKCDCHKEESK